MTRAQVIASCLLNSSMYADLQHGERIVASVFASTFLKESFAAWNRDVADSTADHIIKSVGRAMRIKVDRFIDDLRQC